MVDDGSTPICCKALQKIVQTSKTQDVVAWWGSPNFRLPPALRISEARGSCARSRLAQYIPPCRGKRSAARLTEPTSTPAPNTRIGRRQQRQVGAHVARRIGVGNVSATRPFMPDLPRRTWPDRPAFEDGGPSLSCAPRPTGGKKRPGARPKFAGRPGRRGDAAKRA